MVTAIAAVIVVSGGVVTWMKVAPPASAGSTGGSGDARLVHNGSTRTWVGSFAPGTTQFLTHTVKSHGALTAKTATDGGRHVLRIVANQLFVYAIEPPRQPTRWMRIVYHVEWRVDFAQFTDPGGALQPWVLAGQQIAGALCSMGDGYIHPDFPSGPAPKVKPTGTPVNPYAMATGGTAVYTCHATTGT